MGRCPPEGGGAHEESSRPGADLPATDAQANRRRCRRGLVGADSHESEHAGVRSVRVCGPVRAVFRVLGGELCSSSGCGVLCRASRDLRPRRLPLLPNRRRRLLLRRQRHSCSSHRLCRLGRLPWWLEMYDDLRSGAGRGGQELRSKPQGLRCPVWHCTGRGGRGPYPRRLVSPATIRPDSVEGG
jgi:hypothetical protein